MKGHVAVITGSASGIGRFTAELLAKQCGALVLIDNDATELARTHKSLKNSGCPRIEAYVADVSKEKEVEKTFRSIRKMFSRVDILINAVGGSSSSGKADTPLEETSMAQWNALIDLNLTSTFLCCRAVLPLMKKGKYGRIINFSSIAAQGRRDQVSAAYAVSKAGVEALTKKLAREIGPFGITCNAIAPGITLTKRIATKFWDTRSAKQKSALLSTIALRRLSLPEEQANVIAFLASSESSYLTGQTIEVSGGI
jgi:NAD(P)-dependent dehydrogenase (short-subunit alcohol dehydrogenase family)